MTMVDLDFEEQLKETNFPDLLDGTQPSSQQKKKEKSRRKVEKENKQGEEKRRVEGVTPRSNKKSTAADKATLSTPILSSANANGSKTEVSVPLQVEVPTQAAAQTAKTVSLKPNKQSRVSVDPPVSPASGISSANDNKSKQSSSSSSRLTAANIEKYLTPQPQPVRVPGDGTVDMKKKNMLHAAHKPENNVVRPVQKLTHKSIKRDFLEQVSYEKVTDKAKSTEPSPAIFKDTTATSANGPHGVINELEFQRQIDSKSSSVSSIPHEESLGYDDDDDDGGNDDVANSKEMKTTPDEARDLLERARDRIARQRLVEQVKALEMIVERKNAELEQLNGQLRRAVETKSDLVVAHNEIEKRHAMVVEKKEQNLLRMKQANIWLLEAQSIKEKELLNEIIRLTDMTRDAEEKRREELDDWERMHRNEMLEKDYTIARLSEELRKLGVNAESPIFKQQQKNKGFYDPTSIITGASKYFFN